MKPSKPKPEFGQYSRHFTPEAIARIEALSIDEYLKQVRIWLRDQALELSQTPGLTRRERVQLANLRNKGFLAFLGDARVPVLGGIAF
jgi:hypothetical protein